MHLFIIILKEADTGFEHTKFVSASFNLLVIQNHNIDGGGRYEGKDSIKLWQIIVKWAKKIHLYRCNKIVVREKGLEPPRRKAPDPKSGASANSATLAVFELVKLGELPRFVKVISKTIPFVPLIQSYFCVSAYLLQVCLSILRGVQK